MKRFQEFTTLVTEAETPMGQARNQRRQLINKKIDILKARLDFMRTRGKTGTPAYQHASQQMSSLRASLSKI